MTDSGYTAESALGIGVTLNNFTFHINPDEIHLNQNTSETGKVEFQARVSTLSNSPDSAQWTPASWAWEHPVFLRYFIAFLHTNSEFSVPLQTSLVSHIGPEPAPNVHPLNNFTAFEKFNILHATWPSLMVQRSSQIVPHSPKANSSTRPIELAGPPARRATMKMKRMLLWPLSHHWSSKETISKF